MIKKFDNFDKINEDIVNWRNNPDNTENEWTVSKLIEKLHEFDGDTPVRIACQGYHGQEINFVLKEQENISEESGHSSDDYYDIVHIIGNGSHPNEEIDEE